MDILPQLPDNSVDLVLTDPPYHLTSMVERNQSTERKDKDGSFKRLNRGFMGKEWDGGDISFLPETWKGVLRVLKPGGHLLAFGGTRTYHRMACAIEDAGFEVRDMIEWIYGSGFPKSLNIGKAVDKLQGNEREQIGRNPNSRENCDKSNTLYESGTVGKTDILTKGTSEWEGWGTALKPAHEPICMARKPLSEPTVAENVLKWGTGGINIDGSRVEYIGQTDPRTFGGKWKTDKCAKNVYEGGYKGTDQTVSPQGRFPANLIHDGSDEVVGIFPQSKGQQGDVRGMETSHIGGEGTNCYGEYGHIPAAKRGDTGSASRFFYCAKASKSEREIDNKHPTVKPIALIEYLIKLASRDGQIILDPFLGSGTTAVACEMLQRRWVGIEISKEYCDIAVKRLQAWKGQQRLMT